MKERIKEKEKIFRNLSVIQKCFVPPKKKPLPYIEVDLPKSVKMFLLCCRDF